MDDEKKELSEDEKLERIKQIIARYTDYDDENIDRIVERYIIKR